MTKSKNITFFPNPQKIIEVILYITSKRPTGVNMYNILKILFHADVLHINNYGRPITGDRYIAMPNGTVPSLAYDLLKREEMSLAKYKINEEDLPFKQELHNIVNTRDANIDYLSESDEECLDAVISELIDKEYGSLRDYNHEHIAWIKSFNAKPNSEIDYNDMIHNDDVRNFLRENCINLSL